MLLGDDVVRFVRLERIVLVKPAVFAAASGAGTHSIPQGIQDRLREARERISARREE